MFLPAVDCGRPEPLQNGSIIGENTVYPNFVDHICDEGFILRGSPKMKCQANGTWSKTSSFCQGIESVCNPARIWLNAYRIFLRYHEGRDELGRSHQI